MTEKTYLCSANERTMAHNGNFSYGFWYYFYFSE